MNRNWMTFVFAAAVLCAVGAYAQDQAPSADQPAPAAAPSMDQSAPAAAPAKMTKAEKKKMAWENGVKTDCAAEIADGGVCAGKDFSTGLEKCLHMNRAKLSDGCKAAVRPHHKGKKKAAMKAPEAAPAEAPAAAPAETPAATPAQ